MARRVLTKRSGCKAGRGVGGNNCCGGTRNRWLRRLRQQCQTEPGYSFCLGDRSIWNYLSHHNGHSHGPVVRSAVVTAFMSETWICSQGPHWCLFREQIALRGKESWRILHVLPFRASCVEIVVRSCAPPLGCETYCSLPAQAQRFSSCCRLFPPVSDISSGDQARTKTGVRSPRCYGLATPVRWHLQNQRMRRKK